MMMTKPAQAEVNLIQQEVMLATRIPYSYLVDIDTVETKSGNLLQVIQLEGLYAETLNDETLDQEKHRIHLLLNSLADSSLSIYLHMVRKPMEAVLKGNYKNKFAQQLNDKWMGQLAQKPFFINQYYLTVVKKPPTGKLRKLSDLFKSLSASFNQEARDAYRHEVLKQLNQATHHIILHLQDYGPRRLGDKLNVKTNKPYSELLSFLSYLINVEDRNVSAPMADLASFLPYQRLFFDKVSGTLAFRNNEHHVRYAAILAIKHYASFSSALQIDPLLDLPFPMMVTQTYTFLDKSNARSKVKEQARNQAQSEDNNSRDLNHAHSVLEDINSQESVMGEHTFSVILHATKREVLETNIAKLDAALADIGITAIREDIGLKAAFFASLPANHAYLVRKGLLPSKQMAGFMTCHNFYTGRWQDNYWGEPVTILETVSGAPFAFNFHVLDVANTFLIGPMGSGKTLFEAFTLILSLKAGGRWIVFDKDRGLETALRALGGNYSILSSGTRTGMAPFQLPENRENQYAVATLMRMIAERNNSPLQDEDILRIKQMVRGAYQLPKDERVLRNVIQFLGMPKKGSLRLRFENWVNDGDYAWVFDNEEELFSPDNPILGCDVTSILDDPVTRGCIYFYRFHQLENMLDGTRTRITLAEGWKALEDTDFRNKIQDWSSTNRKKEVFLVLDTQAPSDIANSSIGCKIIQESVTQIYLANPDANYEDYVLKFGLRKKEYDIIKSLDKGSRYCLIKQGQHSVVARANLYALADEVILLSNRHKYHSILKEVLSEVGENPESWIPLYLKKVKKQKRGN